MRGEKKADGSTTPAYAHGQHHSIFSPALGAVSDSSLKFTHVLYNLSPAGKNFTLYIRSHFSPMLKFSDELIYDFGFSRLQSSTSRLSSMRKVRLSLPMERWRRFRVRRLVELREISVSLEMRRQRTSFGGESEYLDLHFS